MRHAVAFDRDETEWPDDSLRPLTPEGQRLFQRAARGMARIVPTVDVVLASPFVRAWRTAEILSEVADWPRPTRSDAMAADRGIRDAVRALGPLYGKASVAVVGHEPNLSDLASYLLTGGADVAPIQMKKGAVAGLRIEGRPAPRSASLRFLATPKLLRALDRSR